MVVCMCVRACMYACEHLSRIHIVCEPSIAYNTENCTWQDVLSGYWVKETIVLRPVGLRTFTHKNTPACQGSFTHADQRFVRISAS